MKLLHTFNYYRELWRVKRAKKKADRMHKLDGKRYWVLKLQGKYWALNTVEIKELKRRKVFRKDLDISRLLQVSIYHT